MHGRGSTWLSVATAALALSGCSAESPPAAPVEALTEEHSEPLPEWPRDSGLAIKRGLVTMADDVTTFQPCGETAALWVVDQTERMLADALGAEFAERGGTLYLEAYGERLVAGDDMPQARDYAGMFILEEVLYASLENAARGCANPPADYIVAARGNEPFWSVEVQDAHMIWRQPDHPQEIELPAITAQDAEGTVRYHGSVAEHELELLLDAQPCQDTMSGDVFAYTASAILDGVEFSGCARVGR